MPRHLTPGDDVSPARTVSDPGPAGTGDADQDARGRELAMRLPDWDLLPPTEFLDRARGRAR